MSDISYEELLRREAEVAQKEAELMVEEPERTPLQSRTVKVGWLGALITTITLQKDSIAAILCSVISVDCGLVGKILTGVLTVIAFINGFFVQHFRTNTKGEITTKAKSAKRAEKLKKLIEIQKSLEEDDEI